MRTFRSFLLLLAAVPLVIALAGPAAATSDQPIRFDVHLVGADQPLEMGPGQPPFIELTTFGGRCSVPSTWVTTIDSAGTSWLLGRVTVTQSHCTTFPFLADPPQHATFVDGRMTVTAANGDELWIRYSGSFDFTPGTNPPAGVSQIHYSSMTLVGGTGRFRNATGTMSGEAVDDWPDGSNTAAFSGLIRYHASDRSHE